MKKLRRPTLSSVLVLVAVISAGNAKADATKKVSAIEVFAGSVDSIERFENGGQGLSFLHDRPVISQSSIELIMTDEKSLSIDCKIAKDEIKVMNKFIEKHPNQRLAFVANGKLIFAPKIRTKLNGESVQISFNDHREYQRAVDSLTSHDRAINQ